MSEDIFGGYAVGGPLDGGRLVSKSRWYRVLIQQPDAPLGSLPPDEFVQSRAFEYRWDGSGWVPA